MTDPLITELDLAQWRVDRTPEECPVCHFSGLPIFRDSVYVHGSGDGTVAAEIVYKCPRTQECGHLFISRYRIELNNGMPGLIDGIGKLWFVESLPFSPEEPTIPSQVSQVSKSYVLVYSQASAAEAYGLDQVAGVGYRKALEFLIKDYCIMNHPESKESIEKSYLAPCIRDYVDDQNVKLCASRAAWLGNDETHYVRKWTGMDLANLKELIMLTQNWIHSSLLTRKYVSDMPR